ncbi:MAG: ABC transporter permease [Planctomycetia bacterium]|nr:ABC transporter permease [Planctomycetia bacterium]
MKFLNGLKVVLVSFIALILIWQVVFSLSHFNEALFPSPLHAWKALLEMASDGSLARHVGTSLYRFACGYVSAVLCAVALGLVLGLLPSVFQFVNPIVQLLRPISPMAWAPFIVLWFGIGNRPAIVVVFIAAFFPVLLSTVSAVVNIDPIYHKVAKNFGVKQPALLWKIVFPAAFPQIANGIHLALGTAWVFLAAGEMNGVQSGLGYMVIDARNSMRTDSLLATILVIGALGLALDSLLKCAERLFLKAWGGVEE